MASKEIHREYLNKLGVPGAFARLKEIVQELENEQSELELQKDELENVRHDLVILLDQYTKLYDVAPVAYLTLDKSGIILEINKSGAQLFGVERSSLINQSLNKFVSNHFLPEFKAFLEKVFTSQSQEMTEIELQKSDNGITVHVVAQGCRDKNSCIAYLMDVTEEYKSNLPNKDEKKYRMIFENITQGIVLCGRDGKIISANKAAKKILGLTFNQIKTRPLLEIFSNPILEDGKVFTADSLPFMKVLNSKKETKDMTFGYMPKNSTHYNWIVISAVSVTMPNEEEPQLLVSFEDITSQKNLFLYNKLTIREKQVFQLLIKGLGRKEIAKNLSITSKTVDKHRENLMEKLKIYLPEKLLDFSKQF